MSDDGTMAIVVIALLGNPFSPAYARARARSRGEANALDFASMNVAVYAKGASAWSLYERTVTPSERSATGLAIGRSTMAWRGDELVVDLDERTTPLGFPLRGRIIVRPEVETGLELTIDDESKHHWWPVAPLARIDVDLKEPGLRFSGHGYHDANAGDVPLEASFEKWTWSCARAADSAILTYDVACSSGAERAFAFEVSQAGSITDVERVWTPMPRTLWGLEPRARVADGETARVTRSLEDGPFYARALLETRLRGQPVTITHEELAAHRLRKSWVRVLTRFRMR